MKNATILKRRFYELISPAYPNEWEVEEIFEHLETLAPEVARRMVDKAPAIWPVSHSLCFAFLGESSNVVAKLPPGALAEWVRGLLAEYEVNGLHGARKFFNDSGAVSSVVQSRGNIAVLEEEVELLSHYLLGISGKNLKLAVGQEVWTDTKTIYLPAQLSLGEDMKSNRLLYQLLVSLQWAYMETGAIMAHESFFSSNQSSGDNHVETIQWDAFRLYSFAQAWSFLRKELPGLIRRCLPICNTLIRQVEEGGDCCGKNCWIEKYLRTTVFKTSGKRQCDMQAIQNRLIEIDGGYCMKGMELLLGNYHSVDIKKILGNRRPKGKEGFVHLLKRHLEQQVDGDEKGQGPSASGIIETADAILLQIESSDENGTKYFGKEPDILINDRKDVDELLQRAAGIQKDLGRIPQGYVQATAGMAGRGGILDELARVGDDESTDTVSVQKIGRYVFDEWDYRRDGYRREWCTLYEKSVTPVKSTFISETKKKYRPQLMRLRRQFEMLKHVDRYLRYQKDGDEIDLDAFTSATCDRKAGRTPSDRLYIRRAKDDRDIVTLFLVDMSNSTEGWVGSAIREALVLLADCMETIGDRYGIYGFSGMRRSRSDLFHIKHIEETYSDVVQQRISGISPREYTRMGPPLRRLTQKLLQVDARKRLLLVISDGKPEDYDDYRGRYGVEDTRKALLEAQGAGIHSFCVTIDRQAPDYLGYLFGRGHYIFIDDLALLPPRLSEMYRMLTM